MVENIIFNQAFKYFLCDVFVCVYLLLYTIIYNFNKQASVKGVLHGDVILTKQQAESKEAPHHIKTPPVGFMNRFFKKVLYFAHLDRSDNGVGFNHLINDCCPVHWRTYTSIF